MKKNRSGIQVMAGLVGMITPLLGWMCIAIFMGCVGNLMATFITVLGGYGFLRISGSYDGMSLPLVFGMIAVFALLRGVLRYAEQASNHYIAFRLLARIRHKVFAALRKLAPAKLDGNDKGNLISIITSDIELLEVFYAHTISPIVIAFLTSLFMIIFLGHIHILFGIIGLLYYVMTGVLIPLANGRRGGSMGQQYRNAFGELNTCVLDNLYGLEEILEYQQKEKRLFDLRNRTEALGKIAHKLKKDENLQHITTDGVILSAGVVVAIVGGFLTNMGETAGYEVVIAIIAIMSSFGPTAALSALSNNLHHTLAAGNRVLDILEETPVVKEITDRASFYGGDILCDNVSFSYGKKQCKNICCEKDWHKSGAQKNGINKNVQQNCDSDIEAAVLQNFQATFRENKIYGILGKSGCGKSTLLKLLMRFYETDRGDIMYGQQNVNDINTAALRANVSYVTQETFLFSDTIENNIKVAREVATRAEVIAAAKKASIHNFIMSTPKGYDTRLAELGNSISGGEKQRIGIARAFLHNSNIIFLDEPTSNIDSLNEGIILKSLEQEKENKTILLVSHRKSTMGIADEIKEM